MKDVIDEIRSLQRRRLVLNSLQDLPFCRTLRDRTDERKQHLVDALIGSIARGSGLFDRYHDIDQSDLNPIGDRVWVFWNTGLETAPPVVRKCVEIMQDLDDVDLVVIDRTNLEEHFTFEGDIRRLFDSGRISIQAFSDILRCQLMARHGGFWLDSTLYITRKDFITRHCGMPYFSFRHSSNDLLLKRKWNEYFTRGLWTMYGLGAGKGSPLFSFIYDFYLEYFSRHDEVFDYFHLAYIWLYAYENFPWAHEMIDSIEPSVSCSYWLGQHLLKPFDQSRWDTVIQENEFQKLNWRKSPPDRARRRQTYLDHFLETDDYFVSTSSSATRGKTSR